MVTKQEQYAYLSVSDGPEMSKSKSTAERLDAGENDSTWPFPVSASTFNISLKVRQITENNNVTMFYYAGMPRCLDASVTSHRGGRRNCSRRLHHELSSILLSTSSSNSGRP